MCVHDINHSHLSSRKQDFHGRQAKVEAKRRALQVSSMLGGHLSGTFLVTTGNDFFDPLKYSCL